MLNEYIDLILNGYVVMVQSFCDNLWFVKMKHQRNKRTIIVEWKPDYYQIKEGKVILKNVGETA